MSQLSMFDFMKPDMENLPTSLDELPEDEMVAIINQETGLDFRYKDDFWKYQAKRGNVTFTVGYSNYDGTVHGGARHISCSWDTKTQGCGSPCNSVEEAVDFFKKSIERTVR